MSNSEKKVHRLTIDNRFKTLIRPLSFDEYHALEKNIIAEGCRTPIVTWRGVIVDGHNRYEICTKNNIPFEISIKDFESFDEAIIWICENQLGRRNITDEIRKYLIGKQYDSEKKLARQRNEHGINQYSSQSEKSKAENDEIKKTAYRIGRENHITHATVEKYSEYSKALDKIGKKDPDVFPKILSGTYRLSHNSVLELSKLPAEKIKQVNINLGNKPNSSAKLKSTREVIFNADKPSIKDMPVYDPDAELTGLSLTIPTWVSSIRRVEDNAIFDDASPKAKSRLKSQLNELETALLNLRAHVEEE